MSSKKLSIIVPTFNEAENLESLCFQIKHEMNKSNILYELIIVDDDSNDNTNEIVDTLLKDKENCVKFISRKGKKKSLSQSVLDGFEKANANIVMMMDADLSHPTNKIKEMYEAICNKNADISIGSRFIEGGGIKGWPWYRIFISKFAASLTLPLTTISDPTSGFMALKKELLKKRKIDSTSWKLVLETVCKFPEAEIIEVPIIFKDREKGQSKLTIKEQCNYIRHILKLYKFKNTNISTILKFLCVGSTGVFVDMTVFFIAHIFLDFDIRISAILAAAIAILNNYILNKNWTFNNQKPYTLNEFLLYCLLCITGILIRLSLMQLAILTIANLTKSIAIYLNILGILIATASNFIGSRVLFLSKK